MSNRNLTPKILHVDDNEDFLSIFFLNYRSWFDITSVNSAAMALDLLSKKEYDVVITDYDMPEMNGLELLSSIKEIKIETPVIFYTGQGNEEIAREAFIKGVSDYFTKDLNAFAHKDKILNSIHRAIDIETANREKRESSWRIIKQQKFLLDLATSDSLISGNLDSLFREITAGTTEILKVERVSIWFFDDNKRLLESADIYDVETNTHFRGEILKVDEYPEYFKIIKDLRVLNVWDVQTDPVMAEFYGKQISSCEILSLLIASVRISGQMIGLVCFEQIGKNRKWTTDEAAFAGEIADQVAHAIINAQNRKAEERERHLNAVLRAIRNVNQIITKVSEREELLSKSCENLVENLGFEKATIKVLNESGEVEKEFDSGNIDKGFSQPMEKPDNLSLFSYEKEALSNSKLVIENFCCIPDGKEISSKNNEASAVMSFILKHSDKVYGVLTVFVSPEIAMDSELQSLFMEVADDISFALSKLEMEEAREIAEKTLFELEERYEMAIKGADLGIWDWDIPSGKVIFNERWAEMLGYNVKEIEPAFVSWENLVHPDDLSYIKRVLNAHIEGKTDFYKTEHRMKSKSGNWVWILDCGKVFRRDENGKPLRAIGIHLDISEKKKAEKALEESEKKYRILFEQANDAIFVIKDKKFFQCNGKTEDLFGLESENIIGKSPLDFSPKFQPDGKESADKALEIIENSLHGKAQIFEWMHQLPDGTPFLCEISLRSTNIDGDNYLMCIARKISDRKKIGIDVPD